MPRRNTHRPSEADLRAPSPGTVLLLAALAAIGPLSTTIILPSFPSMAADLNVPVRDLGVTLSSFFIAFAAGQLLAGPLSDRFGRRPVVFGGLAVYAVGTVACALVSSLGGLLAARVVQAFGVCAASVISRAISRDLFSGEALSKTLSLTMVAMAAAPGFSPLVGSGLESSVGWRGTFLVLAACAVAIALVYGFKMGESHPVDRRAAHTLAGLARGYSALASAPQFLVPALAASLAVGALNAFFAATPAILIGVIGLSPLELGLFFAATVLVVFTAGFAAPRLVHRLGANRVVLAGLVLCTIGGFLLLAAHELPGLGLFSTAIAVFLLGMGLVNPVGTALSLQPFGKQAGLASALLGFIQMALSALATFLVTRLPLDPGAALGWIITSASALALVFFTLSVLRPAPADQAAE